MPLCRRLRTLVTLTLAAASLLIATQTRAQVASVDVAVDRSPGSTRLVLTHSRPVVYVIETSRKRISIRYAEPVKLEPASRRFDDRILERYRMRDGHVLTLDTGPDYARYESFELRNPFRLIIDLRGVPPESRSGRRRPAPAPDLPATIIVIDPGHGGIEHGAIGPTGLMEKEVTLMLARQLQHALHKADASISVVLTRDEDRAVGLDERTAIANHNRADLFLSIHLNASPRADATGAETYYLSTDATDDEARTLAALENRTANNGRPKSKEQTGQGSLDLVLWDLAQNQYLAESSALADSIQNHLNELTGTRNRGVRQAPFRVLMGAMMPAVLVEVGFISNEAEEVRFQTASYRGQVIDAMVAAIQEFLEKLKQYSSPRRAVRP